MRRDAVQSDLVLLVGNEEYGGWYDQSFSRSMEDLCGKFSLSVYHDSRADAQLWKKIVQGDKCEVLLAGQTMMTGWVDGSNPFYSRTDIGRKIEGRDLAADVVDSSARFGSGEWSNVTFDQIARDVCAARGVEVIVMPGVDVGAPFETFRIETGEKTGEVLSRGAAYRGLIVYSTADGKLMIARVNTARATAIIRGGDKNIISAERSGGEQELFHRYYVEGQDDPNALGTEATSQRGGAIDARVRITRELIIPADTGSGKKSYKKRADSCVKQRRARAAQYTYTLDGWLQANGKPWEVNQRIDVDDAQMDLDMAELVIAALDYKVDRKQGKIVTLTLKSPDAFDDASVPEPEDD